MLSQLRFVVPFALVACALSAGAHSSAAAQAPAAPPPAAPAPAAPAPPAQQAYPQQVYPQQVYPQQVYPQPYQAYPQQYPHYQTYPQQYPPTVYVTQPIKPPPPRPRRTLMIAGVSVLLASYGVGVISGAALVDSACCEDVGWSLLIPVAGPYIAADAAEEGKGLLVLLGTVQVIGASLTIAGGIQYALSKSELKQRSAMSVTLPHGRAMSFDVATTPRMMGPTMKLRF